MRLPSGFHLFTPAHLLKERVQQRREVKPDACERRAAIRAVLQHAGKVASLVDAWQVRTQHAHVLAQAVLRPTVQRGRLLDARGRRGDDGRALQAVQVGLHAKRAKNRAEGVRQTADERCRRA
eukprot:67453-Chlamydomonas_euryale.AAC.1